MTIAIFTTSLLIWCAACEPSIEVEDHAPALIHSIDGFWAFSKAIKVLAVALGAIALGATATY